MGTTQIVFLVILGIFPSIFWLNFYLKKDCHPEPRSMIWRTFLMGIIISPIAVLLQLWFVKIGNEYDINLSDSNYFFIWAALVEEAIKFYAVKVTVLNRPDFDEPVDAMIYMVTAALGFAAIENVLVMFKVIPDGASTTMGVWFLRFVGAILLHALSSGLLGYFLALSWFFQEHRKKLIYIGLAIATLFHFAFNAFLSNFENEFVGLMFATSLLMIMAFLVSVLFDKIKERKFSGDPYLI